MPKLKLWNPKKTSDYHFLDRVIKENFEVGGTGVFIHKYAGTSQGDESTIEDVVFMENRNRKYDDAIYELPGSYTPNDTEFDLTQFGFMLSNDTIVIDFHINQMVDVLGRKLMNGDVLELPHLREHFALGEDAPAYNKFFVVQDGYKSDTGYDPRWWPHIWRIKAKILSASDLYSDIIGSSGITFVLDADGNKIPVDVDQSGHGSHQDVAGVDDGGLTLASIISGKSTLDEIKQSGLEEAESYVPSDPLVTTSQHLYIFEDDNGDPKFYYGSGDGAPPHSTEVFGEGDEFPEEMEDGDYFLRTDFSPATLYQKQGKKFKKITIDYVKKPWTAANRVTDSFIDNDKTDKMTDGTTIKQRQALSSVVKPKED
ncbi:MAG: hypothetical protein CMN60_20465 [Sphingobium sp.]|nr:hypothetical protein [Sphingobium sp.]